ncbi:MAG: M24 family metallopeptidase, partial [Pirellulaceae bacterium]
MQPDYAKRRRKFRKLLKPAGANNALITDTVNVTYLTGFTGDSSYLWLASGQEVLLSDSRYAVQIAEECPGLPCEIRTAKTDLIQLTARVLKKGGSGTLALESHRLTKRDYDRITDAVSQMTPVPTSGLVEQLRAIKDKYEIQTIRKSIAIAERAFQVIRAQLSPEQTELQVAHNLEHQIRAFGGTRCAFDPIVGVGPRGALPHGTPSGRQIGESGFTLVDWGAQFQGYSSDLTRILVTGKISAKLRRVYELVLRAQLAAIRQVRHGASLVKVDQAARKTIENGGFGRRFGHGLGHGFGLQIHESPFISPSAKGVLQSGMVVTIEPGIYLPDWG